MTADILVATHKPIKFGLPNNYKWVQVNAANSGQWDHYFHDDDGRDNISLKNPSYCELTVLYRLWKESQVDFVGLCHYRRFFGQGFMADLIERAGIPVRKRSIKRFLLKDRSIARYLKHHDIILTKPYCPFPLNVYEDLLRFIYPSDILAMIEVISHHSPDYSESLQKVLLSKSISYCNMFVTRREIADQYCTWLFDVLGEIEKRIDISSYDPSHTRVFGYMAEVLLNVYVQKHQLTKKTVPLLSLDENTVPISLKRKTFIAYNLFRTALGRLPERWAQSLWRGRFDYLRTGSEPHFDLTPLTLSSLYDYFCSVGGQNTSVYGSPTKFIRSEFDKVTIYALLCNNSTDVQGMITEIERIRHFDHPFGSANSIRIYPTEPLNNMIRESFLHCGFRVAEHEGYPFLFSTL